MSPGYRFAGSVATPKRIPWLADRSPKPRMSASRRGDAAAISSTCAKAALSSINASRPIRFFKWSLVSSCVSSVSKNQMSRGALGFGTIIMSSLSPAPSTIWITSSCAQCVSAPLTRTARTFLPQSRLRSASTAFLRAASFCAGATASSRSRNTMSAAVAIAFSIIFGFEAGVESSERLSRSVMIAPCSCAPSSIGPMRSPLDQHRALALEDDRPVMLGAPMLEAHDAGVVAIGVALLEHFAVGVQRVAVKNRRGEPDARQTELGQRIFARVLRRQPDANRAGDQPEDQPLAELRRAHAMLVEVGVGLITGRSEEHTSELQ